MKIERNCIKGFDDDYYTGHHKKWYICEYGVYCFLDQLPKAIKVTISRKAIKGSRRFRYQTSTATAIAPWYYKYLKEKCSIALFERIDPEKEHVSLFLPMANDCESLKPKGYVQKELTLYILIEECPVK
jgi:hypothetical protein